MKTKKNSLQTNKFIKKKKDKSKKVFVWEMVMVASQFDFTCDEIEDFNNVKFNAFAPLVVNSAFACEIYLKTLFYITNNEFTRGHDLKELYEQQSAQIQDEIFEEYKNQWLEAQIAFNVPSEFHRKIDKADFIEDLLQVKKAFEEWRYSFEYENLALKIGILPSLRLALRKVMEKYYVP